MQTLNVAAYLFDGSTTSYSHAGSWVSGIQVNGIDAPNVGAFNAKNQVFNDSFSISVIEGDDFVSAPLHLFERFNAVAQAKGFVYEVIGIDRALTPAEKEGLTVALGKKWNVSGLTGQFDTNAILDSDQDFGNRNVVFLGENNKINDGVTIAFDGMTIGAPNAPSTLTVDGALLGNNITLEAGALSVNGSMTISDTLIVSSGSTLAINGAATVNMLAGDALVSGTMRVTAAQGNLTVNGSAASAVSVDTVTGNVTMINGQMTPGQSPGISTIHGDYLQGTNGQLVMELAGASVGEFDQLIVNGTLTAGGQLHVRLLDGYDPAIGETFQLLTATTMIGDFDALQLGALGTGKRWDTSNFSTTGEIRVVAAGNVFPGTASPMIDAAATSVEQSWADGDATIRIKSSNEVLYGNQYQAYGAYKLMNNTLSGSDAYFHSSKGFSSTGSYIGNTRFMGHAGVVLMVDLGRSVALNGMKLRPRNSEYGTDYSQVAMPKTLKVYGSNNADAWANNDHDSWTLIHDQSVDMGHNEGQWSSISAMAPNIGGYQYIAMVVTAINGNYGYLTMSGWQLEGEVVDGTTVVEPAIITAMGSGLAANSQETIAMDDGSTLLIFKYDANSDNGQGQTEYTVGFPANVVADVLVVAGGGGGGGRHGAGAGAGGLIYMENTSITAATYAIKVGNGGVGGNGINADSSTNLGTAGVNSTFGSYTAFGGGRGAGGNAGSSLNGGSGGGAYWGSKQHRVQAHNPTPRGHWIWKCWWKHILERQCRS